MTIELVTLGREDTVLQNILPDGQMEIKIITSIYDGTKLIARGNSRKVIEPGDDTSKEHPQIQALTAFIPSTDVVEKFQVAKQARIEAALATIDSKK